MLVLSGKEVSQDVYRSLEKRISSLIKRNVQPGLAVILVGNDPGSEVYVRSKTRRFASLNLHSDTFRFDAGTRQDELLALIDRLNGDSHYHGILVQLPLPGQLDSNLILDRINPEKDVDGFHPINMGLLAQGRPRVIPCTPKGIIRMLEHYRIDLAGKQVVVVGRSNIVGRPISILTSLKSAGLNATTTLCHSGTRNIAEITRKADVVIAAIGRADMLDETYIGDGAVVVDVGMNRVDDPDSEKGYRLTGDVDQAAVAGSVSAMTPVPGGVGLMTIAMLVENTIEAAERTLQ